MTAFGPRKPENPSCDVLFVHYAKSPIVGGYVVPWDDLAEELRAVSGHDPISTARGVAPHEPAPLNIGTEYSSEKAFIYQVEPIGSLEADPEFGGHLSSSFICHRARVVQLMSAPDRHPQ